MSEQQQTNSRPMNVTYKEPKLPRSTLVVWLVGIGLVALFVWAWLFNLEEVSTGTGKVIPSSKEQIIQSLEGGILTKLEVKEGDVVEKGQVLAQLDPTRLASNVGESQSLLTSAQATAARLRAEVNGTPLAFPEEVLKEPKLVQEETALYRSRRANLEESIAGNQQALKLVQQELAMTAPLVAKGAASEVEVLRLKREANDLQNKINDTRNEYYVKAREELSKANTDIQTQQQVVKGRNDSLQRAVFKAPVRGVVKEIDVTTLGGVIPQNGKLMTIVPLEDKLLIEARISPRDIAFIRPGQEALVKITAYDYAIYGGLHGKVTVISPDTIRDEVKQDQFYYRVYIRTESDRLYNKAGTAFSITPGMVATVDIRTGQKTVLDYLLKPFNKAKEALRER
ncbi:MULTISPECIES: HlyD family type I secretion periplasmic adaptor subunit [Acinetobacter]|uniref:Membrane fusion protein (MFP) family protein n=1 Tax=Acinetobacter corruptisaponis TaxID=3045147 RepID=A0ABY8S5P9_9GAMM|nr:MULTISPECIES: HlyD family type I secretion periplasmic adaptor subunit [Acinetobacter]MDH0033062.1 HlyD family type I secretion periplasmic adaptor subunit [Acinetobacter sp. GD04021]MDH0888366.1 HlyD family type I secretion periplasmic adaptor subunit [Acinetobacter sp. GD03873]MDH1084775.1 HlyD family type I secretion periplasmic adaptor subunit [Acinetobacter sp. GD03983]MDH2191679.1 HlyD family type I secretion periplasmic adaptor subunit [Acinetobacter sp. GD03645]MDH2205339.1 HlyD fam